MPGPFYFAWVDAPVEYDPDVHAVEDEVVISAEVSHDEGDFPHLSIQIRNPRVGLLSRPVWAWFSWDKNWQPSGVWTPDLKPLFLGRLLGIPNTINQEVVTLELIARPSDYAAQREEVAEALRVAPFWDPVFIAQDKWTDPDTVLEAYTRLWHFDRITHEVSTSDIIVGEDGVEVFTEADIPYDSIGLTLGQVPFRAVYVEAQADWTQEFSGTIPIVNQMVRTFTGGALIQDWPAPDTSLGGGWVAKVSYAKDVWRTDETFTISTQTSWSNPHDKHNPGDTMSSNSSRTYPVGHSWIEGLLTRQTEFGIGKASINSTSMCVMEWKVDCHLEIGYEAKRGRGEVARFIMQSNIQPLLTDENDTELKEIKLSSNDVSLPVADELLPLGDKARPSYFETERGQQSLRYLLCLARANLTAAARCVEVSADIPFDRAIELSCRKNAIIQDSRLPGGEAVGKIKSYSFSCDGATGKMTGRVTIGATIGYGNSIEAEAGEPTYVAEGYVDEGYQFYEGEVVVLPGSTTFAYQVPAFAGEDDGLRWPLTKKQVVLEEKWHGDLTTQRSLIIQALGVEQVLANLGQAFSFADIDARNNIAKNNVENVMKDNSIWYELKLRPLNRNFTSYYDVDVIPLELPKQIDLEFAS